MRATGRAGVAIIGGVASLVLAGGVASAVVRSHTDRPTALPPVCRDNPGSAGGALPSGKALQQALGQAAEGSAGAPALSMLTTSAQLGAGTSQELTLRARALSGGTSDSQPQPAPAGTGAGQGLPPIAQGNSGGSGAGSGGPGGAGNGGKSGADTGPLGGSGTAPLAGQGPDAIGNPQQPQPRIKPRVIPPPVPPKPAHHRNVNAGGILLVVLLLGVLAGIVALVLRRTGRKNAELPDGTGLIPADADALAARAMAAGDLDLALRWTFVSGLLRLDEVGVLPYDPTRTTLECAQWVRSARFPVLATGFDLVAYGGRHATVDDVVSAKAGWSGLVLEVTQRTDRARDHAVHGPLVDSQR